MHFQFSSSATDGYCPGIFWKPNPSYKLLSFCPFHVMLTNFHISAYILQNSYKLKININQRGFPKKIVHKTGMTSLHLAAFFPLGLSSGPILIFTHGKHFLEYAFIHPFSLWDHCHFHEFRRSSTTFISILLIHSITWVIPMRWKSGMRI